MKIREVSDPDVLADTLVTLTEELAAQGGIAVQDIASVGAGIPGVVDIRTGSIVYTCNLPLRNIPLRKLFKRRLGLHLYVENDANCAALADKNRIGLAHIEHRHRRRSESIPVDVRNRSQKHQAYKPHRHRTCTGTRPPDKQNRQQKRH